MKSSIRRAAAAITGLALAVPAVLVAVSSPAATAPESALAAAAPDKPNVVFILMDDFSTDLLPTMRNAMKMKREGAWFANSFVADSLCCSSRSVTLTGTYPHQSGVLTNTAGNGIFPIGGWTAFNFFGNGTRSFSVDLQKQGYRTGFIGKFLNRYPVKTGSQVPQGWTHWNAISEDAYAGWNYHMATAQRNGRISATKFYGSKPKHYATKVMAKRANGLIKDFESSKQPYFLEVATYGTHSRLSKKKAHKKDPLFPPAIRDLPGRRKPHGNCGPVKCRSLKIKKLAGFNDDRRDNRPRRIDGSPAPRWQPNRPLNKTQRQKANLSLRSRAQMAQSIDRLVKQIRRNVGPNTYVVLTSDNGYHLGQHRSPLGKGMPYSSDIKVPLIVTGPGVKPGKRNQIVSNLDLATTFTAMAQQDDSPGFRTGRSFADILKNPRAPGNRFAFMEHTKPDPAPGNVGDPDRDRGGSSMVVPTYKAVRTADSLLVQFDLDPTWRTSYAYEYYTGLDRPNSYERTNTFAKHRNNPVVKDLLQRLKTFDDCKPDVCRALTQ